MKRIIFILVSLVFGGYVSAQDATYLNTNQSFLSLNPSFAGSNGMVRNQASYRNQWPNLSGNHQIYQNNFDVFIRPIKAGIALTMRREEQLGGGLRKSDIGIAYAQYFSLADDRIKLVPSLQAVFFSSVLDVNALSFGWQISQPGMVHYYLDPTSRYQRVTNLDFNAGLLFTFMDRLYVGAAVHHLTQPDEGLLGARALPVRWAMHAAYTLPLTDRSLLQFFSQITVQEAYVFSQVATNVIFAGHFMAGGGYVFSSNSVVANAGYRWNRFSLLFQHDISFSALSGNSVGSSELHASFNLRKKDSGKSLAGFESF